MALTALAGLARFGGVGSVLGVVAALACAAPAAPAPDPAGAERARIASEREAVLRRFEAEEAACSQRFAVTPCVDEVLERRRAALAGLRERELRIDEAERRERARQRLDEIARRAAAAGSAPVPNVWEDAPSRPAPAAPAPVTLPASAARTETQRIPSDAAGAARRAQAAEQRRREAEEVRQRIEQRELERAARGRVAVPLPPPPAASDASRP